MSHPYKNSNDYEDHNEREPRQRYQSRRDPDLDDMINGAVRFGTSIGSSVLSSVAQALSLYSTGDGAGRTGLDKSFAQYRRRLDAQLSGPHGGWMTMGVFGWILCGSFGIAALVMAILSTVAGAPTTVAFAANAKTVFDILAPIFSVLTLGSGVMGWAGCHRANYNGRLRKYLRTARDYTVNIQQIARDSVKPMSRVLKDLRNGIADGKLPNACLDREERTLYLDGSLYQPAPPQTTAAQPAQKAAKNSENTADAAASPAEKLRRDGVDFLNYLRSNRGKLDATADAELMEMQKVCGSILGFAYNHPNQVPRLRRFHEYYMPTTRKLLDTALGLGESRGVEAENIRRDITGILHTLNTAYTKLYDTLLQDVSLDISTEIDTLETMLRQDGLTHDFASDFKPSH